MTTNGLKWTLLQVTGQNVDSQNVDKPKRQQTKALTDQVIDKPKRQHTQTSIDQNVDKPKRRQTKTLTIQFSTLYSRIFVFTILRMYYLYILMLIIIGVYF